MEGAELASIGPGLLVLLGVGEGDSEAEADRLADKIRALRVFDDADGRMNEALGEREVLCVSQFTLYGDARRGNRPSFVAAAPPELAGPLYERFCDRLGARAWGVRRADGRGARQRRARDPAAGGLSRACVARGRGYTGGQLSSYPNPFRSVGPGPPFFWLGTGERAESNAQRTS